MADVLPLGPDGATARAAALVGATEFIWRAILEWPSWTRLVAL
jgi:hypothetical protein